MRRISKTLAACAASAMIAVGVLAASAVTSMSEGPAVSDANAKLSLFGGAVSDNQSDSLGGLAGSFTMPLAHTLGLQLDAGYARVGDGNFGSGGAHLFWRDPTIGLFGIYAGYAQLDLSGTNVGFGRTGLEAQYFTRSLTLDLAGGVKFGDIDQGYGRARLQFYPTDNLMLRGGWLYEGANFGTLGIEYQFASSKDTGVALFADTNLGNNDSYSVVAGVRVMFGQDMTLKDRHRRQDPESYTTFDMQAGQKAATKGGGGGNCPFQPSSNLCGFASVAPKYLPKIGYVPPNAVSQVQCGGRLCQCIQAYYTPSEPGPAACGCAAAFNTCP